MKTAVSLPDELFAETETWADRLGVSRSELYRLALSEWLSRANEREIAEKLQAVYGGVSSKLDPQYKEARNRALQQEQW